MDIVDQYRENERKHYIEPMEALIAEAGSALAIELEIHPGYTPGLRVANSLYVGYKIHEKGACDHRILNLLIFETEYLYDSRGTWTFQPEAAARIRSEVLDFWNDKGAPNTRTVYIPDRT